MIGRILPFNYFVLEFLMLYIILSFFFIGLGEIPSIPVFLLILVICLLFLAFGLMQRQISSTLPFLASIVSGGIAYFLDMNIMAVITLTIFLYLRMGAFLDDDGLWKEERTKFIITFYCISGVIFIQGWIYDFPYMNWLYGTVLLFTLLYVFSRYLQQMIDLKTVKNVSAMAWTLGIILATAGIVSLLIPIARWLFFGIINIVVSILSLVAIPIFALMKMLFSMAPELKEPQNNPFDKFKDMDEMKFEDPTYTQSIPQWAWFVIIALLLLVIWLFIRKKVLYRVASVEESVSLEIEHIPLLMSKKRSRGIFREQAPNEYIRKLFFQFQLFARKHGYGRYDHETMEEWFQRIELNKDENLFRAYENVRYGLHRIEKHEAKHIEETIEELKMQLKQRIPPKKTKKGK